MIGFYFIIKKSGPPWAPQGKRFPGDNFPQARGGGCGGGDVQGKGGPLAA
jgi:hypothetical protein